MKVYTLPSCSECDKTKNYLDKKNLEYETVNLMTNPEAMNYVKGLGYKQAPVVVTSSGEHWSGFKPENLDKVLVSSGATANADAFDDADVWA